MTDRLAHLLGADRDGADVAGDVLGGGGDRPGLGRGGLGGDSDLVAGISSGGFSRWADALCFTTGTQSRPRPTDAVVAAGTRQRAMTR
jgi:hypothetical protein